MNRWWIIFAVYVSELIYSFIFAFYGIWYLIFIPAIILGIIFTKVGVKTLYAGLLAAGGVFLSIVIYQPAYRVSEASLLAGVIGIPLGPLFVLVILGIISFLLVFLGTEIGITSVSLRNKQ